MDYDEIKSEEIVLGIILRNGHLIFDSGKLKPYMFSSDINASIYKAMQSLSKDGNNADLILVLGKLADTGRLEQVGGKVYIESLFRNVGSEKDINAYSNRVRNSYKKRALISIHASMPSLLDKNEADVIISDLSTKLDKLITDTGGFDVRLIGDTIQDTLTDIYKRRENPGINGISTGYGEIDYFTGGLVEGTNWYIGGRPSMCKSALSGRILLNVALNGHAGLMFNKEMSPTRINERWLSNLSGVKATKIRFGDINNTDKNKLDTAAAQLEQLPIYVDHNYAGDMDYITSTIRKYHQLHGIQVVVIDYLQLVVERSSESTHELGRASRALKLLSNELGICCIVLSQVNRNCEARENKRPQMSDLRQSGNLEEDADIMVALYREEVYVENSPEQGKLEFIVRKSRDGPTGTIYLKFDKETVNVYDSLSVSGTFASETSKT